MEWEDKVEFLIITALRKEFDPLKRRIFPELQNIKPKSLDSRDYYFLEMESNDKASSFRIAFTCVEQMGRVSAALCARDAIHRIKPRFIILTGIAAIKPSPEIQPGDVVIPPFCIDYALQKHEEQKHTQYRVAEFNTSSELRKTASHIIDSPEIMWARSIDPGNPDSNSTGAHLKDQFGDKYRKPSVFIDKVLACADIILADANKRDEILEELNRTRKDVQIIEMESAGVGAAVKLIPPQGSRDAEFLIIKGICDFADQSKNDDYQRLASLTSGTFLRNLLETFLSEHKDQYLKKTNRKRRRDLPSPMVTLGLNEGTKAMLTSYPKEFADSWQIGIDGAIQVINCPTPANRYGGFSREKISVSFENFDWPGTKMLSKDRLNKLGNALKQWLHGRKAQPNRIRILLTAPAQPVLDHPELVLRFGNSDYFCVKTITEISRKAAQNSTDSLQLSDIFPDRWAKPDHEFPLTCVPYHVSAQGIVIITDPETRARHLILCASNPQHAALVPGWGATFAEQMWAPDPSVSPFRPWWNEYVENLDIEAPKTRHGDRHIEDTLIRGLEEELGLKPDDIVPNPLLLNVCIEQDMYFLTFIFIVEASMDLDTFYRGWEKSADPEISLLAAYPISGPKGLDEQYNPAIQIANLLSLDTFDGGPYLLPSPRKEFGKQPWHISSRMRIYALGRHLCNDELLNYVEIRNN